MDPIVHFEMPAGDKKRMMDFYGKCFDWKFQVMGPEMGDYVLATTTESDPATNRPKQPGAINGGFFQKSEKTNWNASLAVAVKDINASMQKVKDAGGTVSGEPVEIPGVGLYVQFTDTEGNQMSLLQPKM